MRIYFLWALWLCASVAEFIWLPLSLSTERVQQQLAKWSDWAELEMLLERMRRKLRRSEQGHQARAGAARHDR